MWLSVVQYETEYILLKLALTPAVPALLTAFFCGNMEHPWVQNLKSSNNQCNETMLILQATPLLTRALEDGNFNSLVDPQLEDNYNISEVSSMVVCAAACVRSSAWLRIQMSQVVRILEGDVPLRKFSEDILPGHSSVYRTSKSSNFGMKFKLIFGSQECGVSASSGITSEYGLNPSISSGEDSIWNWRESRRRGLPSFV